MVRTAKCKAFEQLVGEKLGENHSLIGVRRRNSLDSYLEIGGGEEIRTPEPLLAKYFAAYELDTNHIPYHIYSNSYANETN